MKIGKGPKRFGGPSQAFLDRKGSQERAKADSKASRIPATGDVNVFLDDERMARDGWTLVRTPHAFLALLDDAAVMPRIRRIALDWHLGSGEPNGDVVAKDLAARLLDPAFLPNLEIIHFHSSEHTKALGMLRVLEEALGDRLDDVFLDIGKPWSDR